MRGGLTGRPNTPARRRSSFRFSTTMRHPTSRSGYVEQLLTDNPVTRGFFRALKPPRPKDAIDWLEEYFHIPFSARSQNFRRDSAPHLSDPIRAATDREHKKVVIRGCTG